MLAIPCRVNEGVPPASISLNNDERNEKSRGRMRMVPPLCVMTSNTTILHASPTNVDSPAPVIPIPITKMNTGARNTFITAPASIPNMA